MRKNNRDIFDSFSDFLFWDVDRTQLDSGKNSRFVVKRVLEYGLFDDWQLLVQLYGLKRLTNEAKQIRNLDRKSMFFVAAIADVKPEEFRCYTTNQSIPQHWNF
jgi:hypothetical protein